MRTINKVTVLIGFLILLCLFGMGADHHGQSVEPVDWKEFVPFLTGIDGWDVLGDIRGEITFVDSHKISQAEATVSSGDRKIELKITDAGMAPMLYGSLKMMMNMDVENEVMVAKKVWINGFPGLKKHSIPDREGEVILLVVDRFIVTIRSSGISGMEELMAVAQEMDLQAIASLAVAKKRLQKRAVNASRPGCRAYDIVLEAVTNASEHLVQ